MATDDANYDLVLPFWIDTDGYSDRDREMFVCGVEFSMIYTEVAAGREWNKPIHNENCSRVRMLCGKLGLDYVMIRFCDTWTELCIPGTGHQE